MGLRKRIGKTVFDAGSDMSTAGLEMLVSDLVRNTYGLRYGIAHVVYSAGCIVMNVGERIQGK